MNAAMRQVYVRCGFTVAAAAAFDDQGIDSLPELRILTDLEVENLCKVIRRPGGSVQNHIEGHAVSLRDKNNLKLAAYWLRQQDKVARVVTPAQVLLDTIRAVRAKSDADAAYKNQVTADYPVINDKDWRRQLSQSSSSWGLFLDKPRFHLRTSSVRLWGCRKAMTRRIGTQAVLKR